MENLITALAELQRQLDGALIAMRDVKYMATKIGNELTLSNRINSIEGAMAKMMRNAETREVFNHNQGE